MVIGEAKAAPIIAALARPQAGDPGRPLMPKTDPMRTTAEAASSISWRGAPVKRPARRGCPSL
jgi:hypothetical protein